MGLVGGEASGVEANRILAQELERLLAVPAFMRSPVMCRLLIYLVEHRLQNAGPPPKAYVIATEALGKPADFDPSVDSYPRVMVGRLRTLLERHYASIPWLHRLRIPQGTYEIVVQHRTAPPSKRESSAAPSAKSVPSKPATDKLEIGTPPAGTMGAEKPTAPRPIAPKSFAPATKSTAVESPTAWLDGSVGKAKLEASLLAQSKAVPLLLEAEGGLAGWKKWAVMICAILVAAMIGGGAALIVNRYASADRGWFAAAPSALAARPLVHILVGGGSEAEGANAALADALGNKLRDGIRRFEMFESAPVAHIVLRADNATRAPAFVAEPIYSDILPTEQLLPDYIISGFAETLGNNSVHINIALTHPASNRTLWSRRMAVPLNDLEELSTLDQIISQLAGDYGFIVRDQIRRDPDNFAPGYPCLAQYHRLRSARHGNARELVAECLQKTVELAPQDVLALSALSGLKLMEAHWSRDQREVNALRKDATYWAERAFDAAPASAHGIYAQTQAHFYNDDCQQMAATAATGRNVLDYDADIANQMGFYHVICGASEEGERYLRRAVLLDRGSSSLAISLLAALAAERGQAEEAISMLGQLANVDRLQAHYLAVNAYALGRLGRLSEAQDQWRGLLKLAAMNENARAEDVLRRFTISDLTVHRVLTDLRDVGVVPTYAEEGN